MTARIYAEEAQAENKVIRNILTHVEIISRIVSEEFEHHHGTSVRMKNGT